MSSYFKFLSRNKLYTAIEAVGLAVSLAFVILIGNYVWQQWSIARENPIGDRVYAVGMEDYVSLSWWDKEAFESRIPEVEAACRVGVPDEDHHILIGADRIRCTVTNADPEFFDLFPEYSLVSGGLEEYAIKGHCLISETMARRLTDAAGENSLIGRTVSVDDDELVVAGIFKDFKGTLMPHADILVNPEFDGNYARMRPFSVIGQFIVLVKVAEGTSREFLHDKVNAVCKENYSSWGDQTFPMYSVPELYFVSNQWAFRHGDREILRMLVVVVLLLLAAAIFNYVNLSLALSGKRAKEMATRRLLGASSGAIVRKYIGESVLFTAVCFAAALLLAWALLPMMNTLLMSVIADNAYAYAPLTLELSAGTVCAYIAAIVALGTLTGISPALFASRFAPIDIVRGTFRRRSKMTFSKIFIVFQNVISVVLIAIAVLMEAQLAHMSARPLNCRTDGLYRLVFYSRNYAEVEPLMDRLDRIPEVKRAAYGTGFPGQMEMAFGFKGDEDEKTVTARIVIGSEEYFDMLGVNIIEDSGTPKTNSLWFSKSIADELAVTPSTAQQYPPRFRVNGAAPEYFGGVFEDVATMGASSSEADEGRCAIVVAPQENIFYGRGILVEVDGNRREAAKKIMAAYGEYCEERHGGYVDCQHGYISEMIAAQLMPVRMSMRLLELFMALSVLISLLGLVAMSTYFSNENTKGIALRKIFGSDVRRETLRMVRDYMLLVGVAILIGTPLSVWLSGKYLSRYAYRIEGYWWIFALAALISLLIALFSVLWQVLKAAETNPARELTKE